MSIEKNIIEYDTQNVSKGSSECLEEISKLKTKLQSLYNSQTRRLELAKHISDCEMPQLSSMLSRVNNLRNIDPARLEYAVRLTKKFRLNSCYTIEMIKRKVLEVRKALKMSLSESKPLETMSEFCEIFNLEAVIRKVEGGQDECIGFKPVFKLLPSLILNRS